VDRRLLLFPNGNKGNDQVSLFLESLRAVKEPAESKWHCCVSFALALVNSADETIHRASGTSDSPFHAPIYGYVVGTRRVSLIATAPRCLIYLHAGF
jgi:hypothetical protein